MDYFSHYLLPIFLVISTIFLITLPAIIMMIYNARKNLSAEKRNNNKINLLFIVINFGVGIGLIFIDNGFGRLFIMLFTFLMNIPFTITVSGNVKPNFFHLYTVMPGTILASVFYLSCLINETHCFDPKPVTMFFIYLIFSTYLTFTLSINNFITLVKNQEIDYIIMN